MKKKILYVDDDPLIRVLINRFLSAKQIEVHLAEEGNAGLALLNEHKYDVILTDINMPNGLGGFEFIKEIKNRNITTTIIVLSGYSKNEDLLKEIGSEIEYFEKPVNLKKLVESINKVSNVK